MIEYSSDAARVSEEDVAPLFDGWSMSPSLAKRLEILRAAHGIELAWDQATLVGFVSAISDGVSWAYVTLLEVLPGYRRRGIGAELMRRILERYHDLYAFDLNCDDGLVPFYERFGMQRLNGMVIRNHTAFGNPVEASVGDG